MECFAASLVKSRNTAAFFFYLYDTSDNDIARYLAFAPNRASTFIINNVFSAGENKTATDWLAARVNQTINVYISKTKPSWY